MKKEAKKEATRLRKENGLSYNKISKILNISKSTLSVWLRDIELTKEQKENLKISHRKCCIKVGRLNNEKFKKLRIKYQESGKEKAKENNPNHKSLCMLYWAEGSKTKNSFRFSNSDPYMIKIILKYLKEFFPDKINNLKFSIKAYTNNGLSVQEIEFYWNKITGFNKSYFDKTIVDNFPTSSSGKKKGKIPYGVLQIKIYSTEVVQHIFGAIQEYGNFSNPKWL